MKNYFLILSLITSPVCFADGLSAQERLDLLNTDNVMLAAQLKNIELSNKIRESSAMPVTVDNKKEEKEKAAVVPDAKILLISGDTTRPMATLLLNGSQIKVSQGMNVYGLGTVLSVSLDQVVISRGKSIFTLPFVTDQSSAPINFGSLLNGSMSSQHGGTANGVPAPQSSPMPPLPSNSGPLPAVN